MLKKIILAAMTITVSLSAADKPTQHICDDTCYELVRDRIDEQILGVSKDAYLRPAVATIRGDVIRAGSVNPVTQLIAIEKQIPEQCRNPIGFNTLRYNHLHFRGVVDNVVPQVMLQLTNATGRTIAQLLDPQKKSIDDRLSSEMHEHIILAAKLSYLREKSDFNWRPWLVTFGKPDEDIHYAQLQGHGINLIEKVEVFSEPSTAQYYLRGTKNQPWLGVLAEEHMFWSLNDGKECDAMPSGCKSWGSCSRNSYVEFGDMLIILGKDGATKGTRPILEKLHNPEIVVFHKPAFLSCLCQDLFKKSKKNKEELLALQKFVTEQASLSGEITYSKANLLRMIKKELIDCD